MYELSLKDKRFGQFRILRHLDRNGIRSYHYFHKVNHGLLALWTQKSAITLEGRMTADPIRPGALAVWRNVALIRKDRGSVRYVQSDYRYGQMIPMEGKFLNPKELGMRQAEKMLADSEFKSAKFNSYTGIDKVKKNPYDFFNKKNSIEIVPVNIGDDAEMPPDAEEYRTDGIEADDEWIPNDMDQDCEGPEDTLSSINFLNELLINQKDTVERYKQLVNDGREDGFIDDYEREDWEYEMFGRALTHFEREMIMVELPTLKPMKPIKKQISNNDMKTFSEIQKEMDTFRDTAIDKEPYLNE